MPSFRRLLAAASVVLVGASGQLLVAAPAAHAIASAADLVVTEIAYGGSASYASDTGDGEYVELTNIGGTAQNVSGWFFDSVTSGTPSPTVGVPLSGLADGSGTNTVVAPGESVIITDLTPTDFRTEWGLQSSVKVLNDLTPKNTLGKTGIVYISNGTTLLDKVTYDLTITAKSGSAWVSSAHVADQQATGGSTMTFKTTTTPSNGWTLSTAGDSEGSWSSVGSSGAKSVGSPAASTLGTSTPANVRTATVTISGGSNQNATVGTAFSLALSASGGTAPYTWNAPALAAIGLGIDSNGAITGTPSSEGTINVTVTATDTTRLTGSTSFTITVTNGLDPNWANIVINEVTSDNSDNDQLTSNLPPALNTALGTSATDLVELYNKGTQAVDISGWKQADSHGAGSATVFSGRVFDANGNPITSIAGHGYGVFKSGQGLGSGGDAVQIYLPDGSTLVDSVTYGAAQAGYDESVDPGNIGPDGAEVYHALVRCPSDGAGAVNTNSNDATTSWYSVKVASFGSSNNSSCDDSSDATNAVQYFNEQPPTGLPGNCTPSQPSGSNSVEVPDAVAWPTTDGVTNADNQCEFVTAQDPTGNDMSGLVFSADGNVLWGAQNKNHVWKLVKDPGTGKFVPATDNDWGNGKAITFTGTDPNASQPDDEGLTVGGNGNLFVTSERDNANSNVSKDEVLEYDPTASGATLAPVQQWNLTSEFVPSVIAATGDDANLGFEGVTYVPDSFLTANGFHDQNLNKTYNPADYPLHGSGLFFLALEKNGHVYAYALNSDGSFQRVADIDTGIDGTSAIADVQFNADDQGIWTDCDNDCGVVDSLLRIDSSGNFTRAASYNRPAGLPDDNLEGFAIAPASTATGGKRQVVWSDDGIYGEGNAWNADHSGNAPSADWGHALYAGTLPLPVTGPPTVTDLSVHTGPTSGGTDITVTGTGFAPGDTVVIGQGHGAFTSAIAATGVTVVDSTHITATTGGGAAAGDWNLFVIDPDNTASAGVAGDLFTYSPAGPPTVSTVTPNTGPDSGGTPITITGTGFTPGDQVVIGQGQGAFTGALAATNVQVVDSTHITATTTGWAATGDWNLFVIDSGNNASPGVGGDLFTYTPASPPAVSNVTPNTGPDSGRTDITITGTGFAPGDAVAIGQGHGAFTGALAATNVQVVDSTHITAATPGGALSGGWNLFVTDPDNNASPGVSGDLFTYIPPAVSDLSVHTGPTAGGTPITITGTGFVAGDVVVIGQGQGAHAGSLFVPDVTFVNSGEIDITTPAGALAGSWNLFVIDPDNNASAGVAGDLFTYTS